MKQLLRLTSLGFVVTIFPFHKEISIGCRIGKKKFGIILTEEMLSDDISCSNVLKNHIDKILSEISISDMYDVKKY